MKRIAEPVVTEELCSYGCGQVAKYRNGSNKLMCLERHNSCPANRKKNSSGCMDSGRDYSDHYRNLPQETKDKMAWARGKTSDDPRVRAFAKNGLGKRKVTDEDKLKKIIYREQCSFNLAGIIQHIEGYQLLVTLGMYNRTTNRSGVVRDHIVSVNYGFKNSIDPKIISHPANCRFISHMDNAKKTFLSEGTLDDLIERIKMWNNEPEAEVRVLLSAPNKDALTISVYIN